MIGKDIVALAEQIKNLGLLDKDVIIMDYDEGCPDFGWIHFWKDDSGPTVQSLDWINRDHFEYSEYDIDDMSERA